MMLGGQSVHLGSVARQVEVLKPSMAGTSRARASDIHDVS